MGGHPAGDLASAIAAEEAVHRLRALVGASPSAEASPGHLGAGMAEAVRSADLRVRRAGHGDPSREGMGTTLTALLVERGSGRAVLGHVGDSRAYRFRGGLLEPLTRDHTWVREQVDAGRLTPERARGHPYASVLTQALGVDDPPHPDVVHFEAGPGDLFLLCSDGLTGMLDERRIEALLAEHVPGGLERAAETLVEAANLEGGRDNITVALLAVDEPS